MMRLGILLSTNWVSFVVQLLGGFEVSHNPHDGYGLGRALIARTTPLSLDQAEQNH